MPRRLITLLLGLILPLAISAMACGGGTSTPASPATVPASTTSTGDNISIDVKTTTDLTGPKASFLPADFKLQVGKSYTFNVQADSLPHFFVVEGLNINEQILPNATKKISVKVDKPGTYNLVCTPHAAWGMVGTITVS